MPESAWKLLFYTISWSYGCYLLFFTDYPFFYDPPSVFYGTVRVREKRVWSRMFEFVGNLSCTRELKLMGEKFSDQASTLTFL